MLIAITCVANQKLDRSTASKTFKVSLDSLISNLQARKIPIIPTTTGAAKALSKIFPHLEIGGCGIRVPVPNGSLTDITFIVNKNCTIEEVNQVFLEASQTSHKDYVVFTEDPIVSIDVVGNPASCLFDAQLTSVLGKMVKVVSWYDNEMGYSNRLADLIQKIS